MSFRLTQVCSITLESHVLRATDLVGCLATVWGSHNFRWGREKVFGAGQRQLGHPLVSFPMSMPLLPWILPRVDGHESFD